MTGDEFVELSGGARVYVTGHQHRHRAVHLEGGGIRTVFVVTDDQARRLARLLTGEVVADGG